VPRVAIVTGSDSGIGRATAVALAAAGCDVGVTWHRDEQGAKETAAEVEGHGRRAHVRRSDVSDIADAVAMVDEFAQALGGVDVFVNNAGTGHSTPVLDVDEAQWRRVVETDLTGAFFAAQAAARKMVDQGRGGRIVNVTSVHEHVPLNGSVAYTAAKAGIAAMAFTMARDLGSLGIRAVTIAPSLFATGLTAGIPPQFEEQLTKDELLAERFRGIRPAFGYPACPDHTEKRKLFELLAADSAGLALTESFAMTPAAAVSGIYLANPSARYFSVGRLGRDQVEDYAGRKGLSLEEAERWLRPNLGYEAAELVAS